MPTREIVTDRIIVVKEEGKEFKIFNPKLSKIEKIHVDGELITQGPRCDWAFLLDPRGGYLVELKGTDLRHALIQLETTFQISLFKNVVHKCHIVCSRYPRQDSSLQIARYKFKSKLKIELDISTRVASEVV